MVLTNLYPTKKTGLSPFYIAVSKPLLQLMYMPPLTGRLAPVM